MLAVSDLKKSYNTQILFKDVNFSLNPGEKIGLIGPNGCGKTTLMRILAGQEQPANGQVHLPNDSLVAYLPQDFPLAPSLTLENAVSSALGSIEALEQEIEDLAGRLASSPDDRLLTERYDLLLSRVQSTDIGQAGTVLKQLGLSEIDPRIPVSRLSGGQKTRLSLALVLLSRPDIILLDEPTNHLDVAMLEWLESWLLESRQAVLIVSHDREFLNHTVSRILAFDIREHTIRSFAGNYDDYLSQRNTEIDKQWSAYTDQVKEVKRIKADIARTREQAAWSERQSSSVRIGGPEMKLSGAKDHVRGIAKKVARKAKARENRLERYLGSDERVKKPKEDRIIRVEFSQSPHLGNTILELENLAVGYEHDSPLITNINLNVSAGQRIVINGPNGCGKTTLLRTITSEIPPLSGVVRLGKSVRLGVITQDFSMLESHSTAVSHIFFALPNETQARHFLAKFQITDDEALKPVHLLSLGQQARLALAILELRQCNVLLLDEPINHLDIPSRQEFEEALVEFKGAVVAVVHDRYFIRRFAQVVWYVDGGKITTALPDE